MKQLELNEELILMEKYKLTPTELFAVKMILLAQDNEDEYIFKFNNILNELNVKFRDILISLQNKSIILKSYKIPKEGEVLELEDIEINKIFIKNYYKASFELGKELFDIYPMFGDIGGNIISLRTVSKKFNSLEDFYRFYGKSIRWNPNTHKEIIELIKWAKENTTFINCSISSFCINQMWNELKALKDGQLININYDSIKLL